LVEILIAEITTTMFCTGSQNLTALRTAGVLQKL
jgi:isopentenyl diphosphate isomerase/L-lactate dehydrogenase-like FMN-dependent dehydrogenase